MLHMVAPPGRTVPPYIAKTLLHVMMQVRHGQGVSPSVQCEAISSLHHYHTGQQWSRLSCTVNCMGMRACWRCRGEGISFVRLDGSTSAKKRARVMQEFASHEPG